MDKNDAEVDNGLSKKKTSDKRKIISQKSAMYWMIVFRFSCTYIENTGIVHAFTAIFLEAGAVGAEAT